jgi:hypothetical protein
LNTKPKDSVLNLHETIAVGGPVRLPGSKGQNRIDISAFKIRILLKDRLS